MLSAAYALIGVVQEDGRIASRADLFEPKGELEVQSLRIGNLTWRRGELEALNCHVSGPLEIVQSPAFRRLPAAAAVGRSATLVETDPKTPAPRCGRARFLARGAQKLSRGRPPAAYQRGFSPCFWA